MTRRLPAEVDARWRMVLVEAREHAAAVGALPQLTLLEPTHWATWQAAERFLDELLDGLRDCGHLADRPMLTRWQFDETLSCPWCWLAEQFVGLDSTRCELCHEDARGDLNGACLVVGPVVSSLALCSRCRTRRNRRPYDLASAGRRAIAILDRRLMEARA